MTIDNIILSIFCFSLTFCFFILVFELYGMTKAINSCYEEFYQKYRDLYDLANDIYKMVSKYEDQHSVMINRIKSNSNEIRSLVDYTIKVGTPLLKENISYRLNKNELSNPILFNFTTALEYLKKGFKVTRKLWETDGNKPYYLFCNFDDGRKIEATFKDSVFDFSDFYYAISISDTSANDWMIYKEGEDKNGLSN